MDKVSSYEQIQEFVKRIRSFKKGFVTNFYWDVHKHPYWISEGSLHYVEDEGCALLIHQDRSFVNLYYIAVDYSAISPLLKKLCLDCDIVVDLVCKGEGERELSAFRGMGFELYRSLYRMSHIGRMAQEDWVKDSNVIFGTSNDAITVYHLLQRDFNPLCEQLPSHKEVEDYAERQQLLVIKAGQDLQGFLIAELNGATWYLRYWYTDPNYRNKGVGAKLLRASLIDGESSKRQIFWVISDNYNAIKRYEKYGFRRENMNDYVMIKRKE